MLSDPTSGETLLFLRTLWPSTPTGFFTLWNNVKPPGSEPYFHFPLQDTEQILQSAKAWTLRGINTYFGVGLRAVDPGRRALGTATQIACLPGVFLDIDIQGPAGSHAATDTLPPNLAAVEEILSWAPVPPSLVVHTGYGVHAYWLFDAPLLCHGNDQPKVKRLLKGFQDRLCDRAKTERGWHVDHTGQLSRVLRLPGSLNFKIPSDPRPVLVLLNSGIRSAPAVFDVPAKPRAPRARSTSAPALSGAGEGTWLDELRRRMAHINDKGRREQMLQILAGESFAEPGERDTEMQRACSVVAFMAYRLIPESWDPDEAIQDLCEIFQPTVTLWAAEPGAQLSVEEELDKVRDKISRALQEAEEAGEKEQATKDMIARALSKANKKPASVSAGLPPILDMIPVVKKPSGDGEGGANGSNGSNGHGPNGGGVSLSPLGDHTAPVTWQHVMAASAQPDNAPADLPVDGVTAALADLVAQMPPPAAVSSLKHVVIQHRTAYHVFNNERYLSAVTKEELPVALRDDLGPSLDHLFWDEDRDGNPVRKTLPKFLMDHCTIARKLYFDLTLRESWFDAENSAFHEAVCPVRPLEPTYNERIDEWLRIFGGEDVDLLLDWLATLIRLDRQTCALYCVGETGSGKGMLASGLARLWTAGQPTDIEQALGSFNADILHCPLVVADESLPKHTDSAALRRLVGSSGRMATRKNLPNASVLGALRLLLLANNENMMAFKEPLESMDLRAIAGRFLHVTIPDDAAHYLKRIGGRNATQGWVEDGDGIARHVLWLAQNRQVISSGRFLVEGRATRMHRSLVMNTLSSDLVLQWLSGFLDKPSPVILQTGDLYCGGGKLLVTASAVSNHWDTYVRSHDPLSMGRIGSALKSCAKDKKAQVLDRWYHEIDTGLVLEWADRVGAGVDTKAVLARIAGEQLCTRALPPKAGPRTRA